MIDFSDVRGQDETVKTVAKAVLSGTKGLLLVSPPGIGKTMIARRVPQLLGPLSDHERAWLRAEYEGTGRVEYFTERPFRAPHYTVSDAALCGRNRWVMDRAGELQLARFGVLFLDELPEFHRSAIDRLYFALRRMGTTRPVVIATASPCLCSGVDYCTCSGRSVQLHNDRVAKFADRLGLERFELPRIDLRAMRDAQPGPLTADLVAEFGGAQ